MRFSSRPWSAFDGRGVDLGLGLGVIEIDHRGCVFGDQVGVADDVAHSAGKLRAVAGDGALGLRDLRFDGAAVEGEQGVALLDLGAVAEVHGGDRGIDPRLDGDAGDRRDAAKQIDPHRHRLALDGGDFDRHHVGRALRARGDAVAGPEAADKQHNANQGERRHPK